MNNSVQGWKKNPILYEINTWQWLTELSDNYNNKIKLDNIPQDIYHDYLYYFDAIWLMGVWERSPSSRRLAQEHPDLQKEYNEAVDHVREEDIVGSPYAVYYYHVDKYLGGKEGLLAFKKELEKENVKLILDYVPNHVARDHLWTLEKSDLFIEGTWEDMNSHSDAYFSSDGKILAHGKDPYFPPWTDTVQINVFSSEARNKAISTLKSISEICDGVRCDMAMLVTNEIFKKTWQDKVGNPPEKDYWEEILSKVRESNKNFKFIAEVYWDKEWNLMQQGFDYCYDNKLYKRIISKNAEEIKGHLNAEWQYNKKLLRYIENHDEKRVLNLLKKDSVKAAALLILTLPGISLIYETQMKGYKKKVPIQLGVRKNEEINNGLLEFYRKILKFLSESDLRQGDWEICLTHISSEKLGKNNLIAYIWRMNRKNVLIVVNFGDTDIKGHVSIPNIDFQDYSWKFKDVLTDKIFEYNGEDLKSNGLYVELNPWRGHLFQIIKN
ncbi:MAG: alpha-amylase [Candidatus Lokiarchaeota archaeon]|nr:alpha-amylase [Candidatus Lokiarchaeota archaeon]MBD3200243.1 alpha-amylase [Candidatus Lokiarchaeota archaeon]